MILDCSRSFLEERFGQVPADVSAALETVEDPNTLRHLLKVAIHCTGLDQLRDALKA